MLPREARGVLNGVFCWTKGVSVGCGVAVVNVVVAESVDGVVVVAAIVRRVVGV